MTTERPRELLAIDTTNSLVVDPDVREWCKLPYPGHSKGCPNYGQRLSCPPQAPLVYDFIDPDSYCWLVVTAFDLREHASRMKKAHPHWTDRQARCCLYWQGSARKALESKASQLAMVTSGIYTLCPEAMGVDVFSTLHKHDVPICRNPTETVYKVALVGCPPGREHR